MGNTENENTPERAQASEQINAVIRSLQPRRYKFKLWDGRNNKWVTDFQFKILGNGSLWSKENYWIPTFFTGKEILHDIRNQDHYRIFLIDYTGKNDTFDNEAYIGHICKLKDHTDIYEIKWDVNTCRYYFNGVHSDEKRGMDNEFIIIGHKLENPELLG